MTRLFLILFLLVGELLSCQAPGEASAEATEAFYQGLKALSSQPSREEEALSCFEKALRSPNQPLREAAAEKAIPLIPDPAKALPFLAALALNEGILQGGDFYLDHEVDPLYRWAYRHYGEQLPGELQQAAQGRMAAAESRFEAALIFFQAALMAQGPEEKSELFLKHLPLLRDLGRTYQFSDSADSGVLRFTAWERKLREKNLSEDQSTRYYLLYFAGRIARERSLSGPAGEYFRSALPLSPRALDRDACIWYILDLCQKKESASFALLLESYLPLWNSPSYFDDLMEKEAHYLVTQRDWKTLIRLQALLEGLSSPAGLSRSQYSYLSGRVRELGLVPGEAGEAAALYRKALEDERGYFYYRALAASRLGEEPRFAPGTPGDSREGEAAGKASTPGGRRGTLDFLLGFFQHDISNMAWHYIQKYRDTLDTDSCRLLARELQQGGMWDLSIRMASYYRQRADYRESREDMELYYPRTYIPLIEGCAAEQGISAPLLFGLIRTESAFMPRSYSRSGAQGLTQLMESTALEMAGRLARAGGKNYIREGKVDLMDAETNIRLGAYYLAYLNGRLHNTLLALLSYNGGVNRVRRSLEEALKKEKSLSLDLFLESIPLSETREYGRRVISGAGAYGELYYGVTMKALTADVFSMGH